jgi:hypothetical protein
MLQKIIHILKTLNQLSSRNRELAKKIDETRILQAKLVSNQHWLNKESIVKNLTSAEFSVFSQWGDDGIIDFLAQYLDFDHQTFLEFGVENYEESNTRFLLMNRNWSGFVIDGSKTHVQSIKNSELFWKHELTAVCQFITKENINQIIEANGYTNKIGLLHIDIDGNDYHIWKAIDKISPTLVIMEYNSVFGSEKAWTIPYQADFTRDQAHYSHLYCGASLRSLCLLAEEKGYYFIGSNSAGNNAYFVKKGKEKGLKIHSCESGFVASKFRESRNKNGQLNFVSGQDRLNLLKGLSIYNTETEALEII